MPGRSFISALFYSVRPSACVGISLFAIAGLGRWDDPFVTALVFFSAFIGGSGCFLINDIFDREKDLKNNKLRPIATGEISLRTAFIVSLSCCLVMLVSAAFLSFNTMVLSVFLIAGFWLYPYINRHSGLFANIWVSVCSAFAFLYGALVYELTPLVYVAMLSVFFVNVGREILLDSLDEAGDHAVGKPSIPLTCGKKRMKGIVALFFIAGSMVLLGYLLYFPAVWPWMMASLLLLWIPFFMKTKEGFKKWALFNVRTTHLFFLILIVLLFVQPDSRVTASIPNVITPEYCLDRLDSLQSKKDGFYPDGIFPTQRSWISRTKEEDNNVFGTAIIAYILRTTNERQTNERASRIIYRAIRSFEKYRNRQGEASYNFWQSAGDDLPFPNSFLLSRKQYRLPDDYDDTALIQLARGPNALDQPVRDKMLRYALRTERKVVEHFPTGHRSKKVYEVWYADKMQQELDIVVMANVLLFVMEKGYSPEVPDKHTIDCLKTSINEGWYFKDPGGYAQYYQRPAIILYSLARLIDKDTTGGFKAEHGVLIRHLRQALDQTDHLIEKIMIATSLLRLGEPVRLDISREQVIKDAQSFAFSTIRLKGMEMLPFMYWRSEAVSWALMYEFLSFHPAITWK